MNHPANSLRTSTPWLVLGLFVALSVPVLSGCAGTEEGEEISGFDSTEQATWGRHSRGGRGHHGNGHGDRDDDDDRDRGRGWCNGNDQGTPPDLSDDVLDCSYRGSVGDIVVTFDCDTVTVQACKELSNVVLDYGDAHEKFDDLDGHTGTFTGYAPLEGVWVKAGRNHSGDGPGYGQYFAAPADGCEPPAEDPPTDPDPDDVIIGDGGGTTPGGLGGR